MIIPQITKYACISNVLLVCLDRKDDRDERGEGPRRRGESARSAVKLLAASSDDQFVLTSCTHATVRNYVVSQLTTGNAPRPGVLVNMTVANVMSAAQVDDDPYVVSVCTKSADWTTGNL